VEGREGGLAAITYKTNVVEIPLYMYEKEPRRVAPFLNEKEQDERLGLMNPIGCADESSFCRAG